MRKLFGMVVLLFLIYFLYHLAFVYFQGEHNINYQLSDGDNIIDVNEILKSNNKDDDNYSLTLTINDIVFNIQTFYNFKRSSNIIQTVKYYEDNNNKCIFVKYRNNKILNDILCMENNIMISYHNLNNISDGLKEFANSMTTYGYYQNNWQDDTTGGVTTNGLTLYSNNLIENHYVGVSSALGFYRINKIDQIKYVEMYSRILNTSQILLKGFVNDKYIVANYNDEELYRFYVVNMNNSSSSTFVSTKVSTSTYTLGSYGTSLYIYDPTTRKEYELDYDTETLIEVGNAETNILYYSDEKWQRTSIDSDLTNLKFSNNNANDYINGEYAKIIKIGNESGYYYLFKKVDNKYIVYCSNINKKESLMYLFTTNNINSIIFNDNYIYYINEGSLKYYSSETGNKTILSSNELLNDSNVAIGLYIDK